MTAWRSCTAGWGENSPSSAEAWWTAARPALCEPSQPPRPQCQPWGPVTIATFSDIVTISHQDLTLKAESTGMKKVILPYCSNWGNLARPSCSILRWNLLIEFWPILNKQNTINSINRTNQFKTWSCRISSEYLPPLYQQSPRSCFLLAPEAPEQNLKHVVSLPL